LTFDLLILDFQMPGLNCEDVIQRIRIAKSLQKIIVLSMHEESIYSKKVLLAGANLYLTKSLSSEFLIESIVNEMNNIGMAVKSPVIKSKSLLSKQELTIIKLIADGNSSKEIGDILKVSPLTIKAHRRNMMRKLDANNSSELIKIAIAKGIL
jgi:two-component system invasion response regulator UvrY